MFYQWWPLSKCFLADLTLEMFSFTVNVHMLSQNPFGFERVFTNFTSIIFFLLLKFHLEKIFKINCNFSKFKILK